ncbi:hypothetical protein [Halobellus litoreus]|uniref:Uncharacterized protein n=1 Tax=Halobellus litoreus TaxID=755310 RepID=A0ABD6DYX3_9EURY|nr:hypothetical protein [Halobellus litoreus]
MVPLVDVLELIERSFVTLPLQFSLDDRSVPTTGQFLEVEKACLLIGVSVLSETVLDLLS